MKKDRPEIFFVVLIFVFGAMLIFITPFGAGFDEETHLARIWETSKGVLIPNQYFSKGPNYPFVFYQLSYRQDVNVRPVSWETWKGQQSVKIDWDNMLNYNIRTRYFPTFYLLQAIIMGILGRVFDTPVAIIFYIERFSYLFMYASLIYMAIRITPVGKWIFGILSIAPMSLIMASTITADSLNNGIAFIFVAWVLYLNRPQDQVSFSRKEWFITVLLSFAVCTLKLNALPLLFLLLLIPRQKIGSRNWRLAFIIILLFDIFVIGLGWNYYTSSFLLTSETTETYNATDQLKEIFANPLHFLNVLTNSILTLAPRYLRDWIGVSGYSYWSLPAPVYWLTPILILFALLSDKMGNVLNYKKRIIALSTFLIVFIGTWTLFYLLYSGPGDMLIPRIQGRYFLVIGPLLMISLLPSKVVLNLNKIWLQVGLILIGGMTVGGLFLAYHVPCGSSLYTPGLCILPRYKNFSPETSLSVNISKSTTVKQTFTPMCDNMSQIWIWINKNGVSQNALSVKILTGNSSNLIFSRQVPQAEIPSSGWLIIDFPIPMNLAKKSLFIEVDSGSIQGNTAIDLGYSTENEYLDGRLTINKQHQDGDLLFKYGCRVGLEKLFP